MKIVCIGDSLTQGDYGIKDKRGIANVQEKNYPYFLTQNTGWDVVNYGRCGFTAKSYFDFYRRGNVDLAGADVIVVMLGTNGGNDPENDNPFNQAFRDLIHCLKDDAPNAKILLCTPPPATVNPEYSNCGYMPNILKAEKFVRLLANEEVLPLIDVFNSGYFTPENEHIMQPNDGLHFGEEGYRTLAKVIEEGIISNL